MDIVNNKINSTFSSTFLPIILLLSVHQPINSAHSVVGKISRSANPSTNTESVYERALKLEETLANLENRGQQTNSKPFINNSALDDSETTVHEVADTLMQDNDIKKTSFNKAISSKAKITTVSGANNDSTSKNDLKKLLQDYREKSKAKYVKPNNKVILFVWDGLRPDVITEENTPNLYKLKVNGTFFKDHHSSYPTVTMNNANSFATGNYSGGTGFYGNRAWYPYLIDSNIQGVDFFQPVYTQQHKVLNGLQQAKAGKPLMYVNTLLQVARDYGLKTAQIGKAGPISLQDAHLPTENGTIITPNKIYPISFAKELQQKGYYLPHNVVKNYPESGLKLKKDNYDPTRKSEVVKLKTIDGKTPLVDLSDPSLADEAIAEQANEYMMDIYLKEILSKKNPDISIIWFREPDTTEHNYGPGSKPFYRALANQDRLLGKLLLYIDKLGLAANTNLLIASDHGHSNVSGDTTVFPLRLINNGSIGSVNKSGYSVSGNIRIADLLSKHGFNAFDGAGCKYNPVLQGVLSNGNLLHSVSVDEEGNVCNENKGKLYTTKDYKVPKDIPNDAIIVANNGGSAYLYMYQKNTDNMKKLVKFLQSRPEFDCIFINDQYGSVEGTLPMSTVQFFDEEGKRHPDVLVSLSYNDKQVVQGLPGTIYSTSTGANRGSHGSLSPVDIQSVFVAFGPSFKAKYTNLLPTANVDVAVTMAYLLNLPFENRAGRPVLEAIKGSGVKASDYKILYKQIQPDKPARDLKIHDLKSYDKAEVVMGKDSYTFVLNTKELYFNENKYSYIDSGRAIRY